MKTTNLSGVSGNKKGFFNMKNIRKAKKPVRIIGKDLMVTADERSLMNCNVTVFGQTGSGKSYGYVSTNISASKNHSYLIHPSYSKSQSVYCGFIRT